MIAVANAVHIRFILLYVVLGAALWYATYRAGIHPTIAGVVLGLLTPAAPFQRPAAVSEQARRTADETSDDPTAATTTPSGGCGSLASVRRSRRSCEPSTRCRPGRASSSSDLRARERGRRTLAHSARGLADRARLGGYLPRPGARQAGGVLVGSFITVRTRLGTPGRGRRLGRSDGHGHDRRHRVHRGPFIAELAFPPGRGSTRRRRPSWPRRWSPASPVISSFGWRRRPGRSRRHRSERRLQRDADQ